MSKSVSCAVIGLLAVPILFTILLIVMLSGSSPSFPATCDAAGRPATATVGTDLDADQTAIARQVVNATRAFPPTSQDPHAAVIALATARQESGLRNLDYGDRDSLGVFQQRPSQGWGTPDQVRNVAHATTAFLERLVRIPGWKTRPVPEVAAEIQRPAETYRDLYKRWVPLATELTDELWTPSVSLLPVAGSCSDGPLEGSTTGLSDTSLIMRAQSWVDALVPYSRSLYFTNQYGTYRQDCSGYVSMAWGLPSSYTTYTLPSVAHPITKNELRPGDIMLKPGHTLMFAGWADPLHTNYWAYEEQHEGTVAMHHVVPYPYWPHQGVFVPYRPDR